MRVSTDDSTGTITRLGFLLGGEELVFSDIEGQVEFGDSTFDWTYEWPTLEHLVQYNIMTLQNDLILSEIKYKQYAGSKQLSGMKLVFQNDVET